jgi:hypothetical protein
MYLNSADARRLAFKIKSLVRNNKGRRRLKSNTTIGAGAFLGNKEQPRGRGDEVSRDEDAGREAEGGVTAGLSFPLRMASIRTA